MLTLPPNVSPPPLYVSLAGLADVPDPAVGTVYRIGQDGVLPAPPIVVDASPAMRPPSPPEPESHPWRVAARDCWYRRPLENEMRLRYQGCQCKEPADCLAGKATSRLWVGIDQECRACVESGGPPPPPPESDRA